MTTPSRITLRHTAFKAAACATMLAALLALATTARAQTDNFDKDRPGAVPPGWECGTTGKGNPRWAVEADRSAPSAPHVLRQSGFGTFPWCVKKNTSIADGFVEAIDLCGAELAKNFPRTEARRDELPDRIYLI